MSTKIFCRLRNLQPPFLRSTGTAAAVGRSIISCVKDANNEGTGTDPIHLEFPVSEVPY